MCTMVGQQDSMHPDCNFHPIQQMTMRNGWTNDFIGRTTHKLFGGTSMETGDMDSALYEAARRESPKDASVAAQLGKAFVIAHNYTKAIERYQRALQYTDNSLEKSTLSYDLADLFFKLKHYDQAEVVLNGLLGKADVSIEVEEMKDTAILLLCLKGSLLLSKVQHQLGKQGMLVEEGRQSTDSKYLPQYKVMFGAKNIQNWLTREQHGQHIDAIREQRNVAADIYFHFSQVCEFANDLERAVILLKETLNCNAKHKLAPLAMAKVHLLRGDVNECEQKCADMLSEDPFNAEARDILVQSMFYKELYESAILHFKQNLEREPNHYHSMAQLIRLLRNAGQIDDAQQYVLTAEKASSPASHTNAGLYFCKGLIAHYFNNQVKALQMFNQARADAEWGKQAIHFLIEVYLNTDKALGLDEATLGGTKANQEGIKATWKLLGESRLLDGNSTKQLVLECYATMATRQKTDIEFALGRLMDTLAKGEQRVPILLAIATAHTLLNQTPKARSHLQVINKSVYKWHDGEDFERAWLMLASIHIQNGKNLAAEELCRKCLKYNKDCSRAWESLGLMMETSHSITKVSDYLENAWKCKKETSPAMSYHLASTYLKDKRYTEAILVSQKVLKTCNKYPQIKKEVLDKARSHVRV